MTKQEHYRNLRYKKGIAEGFNIYDIRCELEEICEKCDDVRYIIEGDEEAVINALDGDSDEAFEFRIMFSELSAECEQLFMIISEEYVTEYFDDFFNRVAGGAVRTLGYDGYEEDYYEMCSFESRLSRVESEKRLMRLNKNDLIKAAEQCFGVASAMLNIRYKFDYLKAALDVLNNENTSFLRIVRDLETAYEQAADDHDWSGFDRLVSAMPQRVWLE